MKAADARALMDELERIESKISTCKEVLAGRAAGERPKHGPTINFFLGQISVPVSDAVAYMHLDCYLFDLETRRSSIKAQLRVE